MNTCVEGSRRQLPPWMLPKVVAENGDIRCDQKKVISKRKLNSKAKCDGKGKVNLDERNESGDNVNEKKKKKSNISRDSAPRRSTRKRKNLEDLGHGSSDRDHVCQVRASSDDDVELTVEDLMEIAEQYVKDYKDKETREAVRRQCEPKWKLRATKEAATDLDSPHENKKSSSLERDDLYTFSLTAGEVIPTSTSQIDHPAQNMLDVFLGPLLRTTFEKEENWRRENLS